MTEYIELPCKVCGDILSRSEFSQRRKTCRNCSYHKRKKDDLPSMDTEHKAMSRYLLHRLRQKFIYASDSERPSCDHQGR